jgi:signal transduction histidine kinase
MPQPQNLIPVRSAVDFERNDFRLPRRNALALACRVTWLFSSSALLFFLCLTLFGCATKNTTSGPLIQFDRVPLAGAGGPAKLDTIEGRVIGALPGQRIVVFARSGIWWVQPLDTQPFTEIQSDGSWRNFTHLGTEYAALLVDSRFQPKKTMDTLPSPGGGEGVVVVAVTPGKPIFWQTWWFLVCVALSFVLGTLALFQIRMRRVTQRLNVRLEERLAERARIARELHDTLLQDFLSVSLQLHAANDQLAADSPAKPLLNRALEMMRTVAQEGRNTVQGLRSSDWNSQDLGQSFARIQQEFAIAARARLRVIVEGAVRPLRPVVGDDVYLIAREALANAFRHSGGSEIEVELEYAPNELRLLIRDNGCGISTDNLRSSAGTQLGLAAMRERTAKIGATLRVFSRLEAGTEIELCVPSDKAYVPRDSDRPSRWMPRPRKPNGHDGPGSQEQLAS